VAARLSFRPTYPLGRRNPLSKSSKPLRVAIGALVLLLGITQSGCVFSRSQINAADLEQRVTGVVPGTTTIEEVEQMIGSPATSITPLGAHQLHVYTFGDAKTAGLSLILINILKTNMGLDTAFFLVNEQGIVEEVKIGQNSKDLPWQWWAFGD
jgi:hypothetical protein